MRLLKQYNRLILSALAAVATLSLAPSCDREPVPADESGEETGELIRIMAAGSDVNTRGLLNKADLPVVGTTVKVYDYLTGFTGKIGGQEYDNGDVMYIDDAVKCVTAGGENSTGDWDFVSYPWRWTRTGVHHFFGWLTEDKKSNLAVTDLCAPTFSNNVLSVPAITFTKDTKQFDFSYSDIVEVAEIPDNGTVEIPLDHLFTALAFEIKNESGAAITVNSITLDNVANGRSASVNYTLGATNAGMAVLTDGTPGTFSVWSGSTPIALENNAVANAYEGTVVTTGTAHDFRLFWPQDDMADLEVTVNYKVGDGAAVSRTVPLVVAEAGDDESPMEAGKKYFMTITVTYSALFVNPTIHDWIDTEELEYTLKMNTNIRLFDSWLYRYDTDEDYTDYTKWATSHMAVSEGRVTETSEAEPVAGRPLRSPQIQLVTTGVGTFELRVDNSDFEIVRANKNATGVVTSYDASTNGVLTIPAGDEVYTYFYIVPKVGVTPSDPVAKVSLIYNDSVLGPQRVTYNSNSLPGYSDDSSEIWAYYFSAEEYVITGKLRMYFQDYNNPLVPTPTQN